MKLQFENRRVMSRRAQAACAPSSPVRRQLFYVGGAGDPPASLGDSPNGTEATSVGKQDVFGLLALLSVPPGESHGGTGRLPVLPPNARSERAFTLVEIALSLAIIGFALVAIIGILPAGLNVQKENREDTIVNQDGLYFLEAIRRGARGMDDLTNYVDAIRFERTRYMRNADGTWQTTGLTPWHSTRTDSSHDFIPVLETGSNIVGLLSWPKCEAVQYGEHPDWPGHVWVTNFINNKITAYVRAVSGVAAEKATNVDARDFAFAYELTSEVIPYGFYIDGAYPLALQSQSYTNAFRKFRDLQSAAQEIRLTIRWPLRPPADPTLGVPTRVGPGKMSFSAVSGGQLVREQTDAIRYFIKPQTYTRANP